MGNLEKEEIKKKKGKNERRGLTLTGLLMEGTELSHDTWSALQLHSEPHVWQVLRVFRCYRNPLVLVAKNHLEPFKD
jgi:hypothetical protein